MPDTHLCATGPTCRGYNPATRTPETTAGAPLCDPCLTAADRAVRALLFDWLDLEQLQLPSLSQSLTGQPGGRREPPMPMAGGPEALQSEIHHVATTWEAEIRATCGLSDPPPIRRQGPALQRAIGILAPRIRHLARLTPTAVYPTGCQDQPTELTGVDAIQQLTQLHQRARAMLGRPRRTYWVPGECSLCGATPSPGEDGPLYRHEPRHEGDESPVWCNRCDGWRSHDDYERYVRMLVWPALHHDDREQVPA